MAAKERYLAMCLTLVREVKRIHNEGTPTPQHLLNEIERFCEPRPTVAMVKQAAEEAGLLFVSRSHGQATTDTVSLDTLVRIVRRADELQEQECKQ